MADLLIPAGSLPPNNTNIRYKDMGDGTFALVSHTVGGSGDASASGLTDFQLRATAVLIKTAAAVSNNNLASITVTSTATSLVAANAERKSLRFFNTGAFPVAIGSSSLTWSTRSIVLNTGDLWVEDDAPNLSWYGICNSGDSSTITAQEVI